jgi:hypothetical protein
MMRKWDKGNPLPRRDFRYKTDMSAIIPTEWGLHRRNTLGVTLRFPSDSPRGEWYIEREEENVWAWSLSWYTVT